MRSGAGRAVAWTHVVLPNACRPVAAADAPNRDVNLPFRAHNRSRWKLDRPTRGQSSTGTVAGFLDGGLAASCAVNAPFTGVRRTRWKVPAFSTDTNRPCPNRKPSPQEPSSRAQTAIRHWQQRPAIQLGNNAPRPSPYPRAPHHPPQECKHAPRSHPPIARNSRARRGPTPASSCLKYTNASSHSCAAIRSRQSASSPAS
jgi:hypothetical protein